MDLSDISKYIEKISCNVQISKNICNEILEKILSLDMFPERYRIYEEGFEERIMLLKDLTFSTESIKMNRVYTSRGFSIVV